MTSLALQFPAPQPAEITPRTATDLLWLERNLRKRFRGWRQESDGRFCVTLTRADGRTVWCFGDTLEEAVVLARATVKGAGR